MNKEELRSSQIKETRDKIKELDIMIVKGTEFLRDVEEVSTKIRAQSFSEGGPQDERDAGSLALDKLDRIVI